MGGGGGVGMYSFGRGPEAGTRDTELREALLAPGPVGTQTNNYYQLMNNKSILIIN